MTGRSPTTFRKVPAICSLVKPVGSRSAAGCRRMRHGARFAADAYRLDQLRHDAIGIGGQKKIDGWQSLVVHAPAVVDAVIERNLNDFGAGRDVGDAQRAGKIDPVEAQDDVRATHGLDAVRRQAVRCTGIERMIGRKTRADLEIGGDPGVEGFRERDPVIPGFLAARGAAGQDRDLLRAV